MADYDEFVDQRVKHLDMIQVVVTRLANSGFLIKGWALTVAGAFYGFAVANERWELAIVALIPTGTFWGLDAYFLRCERLFRHLYNDVRRGNSGIEPFFMSATAPAYVEVAPADVGNWRRTLRRPTIVAFYGAITIAALLIAALTFLGAQSSDKSDHPKGKTRPHTRNG